MRTAAEAARMSRSLRSSIHPVANTMNPLKRCAPCRSMGRGRCSSAVQQCSAAVQYTAGARTRPAQRFRAAGREASSEADPGGLRCLQRGGKVGVPVAHQAALAHRLARLQLRSGQAAAPGLSTLSCARGPHYATHRPHSLSHQGLRLECSGGGPGPGPGLETSRGRARGISHERSGRRA